MWDKLGNIHHLIKGKCRKWRWRWWCLLFQLWTQLRHKKLHLFHTNLHKNYKNIIFKQIFLSFCFSIWRLFDHKMNCWSFLLTNISLNWAKKFTKVFHIFFIYFFFSIIIIMIFLVKLTDCFCIIFNFMWIYLKFYIDSINLFNN